MVWVIVAVVLSGAFKYARYQVDMYYSNLAPQQFDNDNAYSLMQIHGTISTIVNLVYILTMVLIVCKVASIFISRNTKAKSSDSLR